jgi:hypothetical protein
VKCDVPVNVFKLAEFRRISECTKNIFPWFVFMFVVFAHLFLLLIFLEPYTLYTAPPPHPQVGFYVDEIN